MNYKILNEKCEETIQRLINANQKIDVILTSPPYNTSRNNNGKRSMDNYEARYDVYFDLGTQQDYINWITELFNNFDKILAENGVVLWNVSYGNDTTVNTNGLGTMWLSIADIIQNSPFTVADRIIWKKKSALPNNVSPNKLTRICEDVFVFCRKTELKTFNANKEVSKVGKNGQTFYKNYYNFVEAKNNDGSCDLNKATYSSELCTQLLSLYAKSGNVIFDPFNGTGTTAISCVDLNMNYLGSEISADQCEYSINRINKYIEERK